MTGARDVLFDLDGTLTDNYAGIAACVRHALTRLDAAVPDDANLRQCVGPPLRATFARLLATQDPGTIETALGHYRERFADVGWRENVPYPGIDAALAALRATGARLFVCTAKPRVYAERIVAHFGLGVHFEAVYGADMGGLYDDKAHLMAHLIAQEHVDPSAATMVGDRVHDIRAARINGARALGVLWGYGTREELAEADALVDRPDALPEATAALYA